jgi:hypothetical protein
MNYTTIEQSNKLVELGLNPDTADMKWYYWKDEIDAPKVPTLGFDKAVLESYKNTQAVYLPCWSLGALFEVMPEIDNQLPSLRKYKNYYCVVYSDNVTRLGDNQWQNGKTPTEAAYNMVVWLIENGYINKGE